MASKRIKVKIKELGKVVGGATPSTKNPENWEGSIPWLTPKDLANHRERFIKKGEKSISQKGYESCSTKMLPKGTVLFSSRAPIGYCAIAENDICTNQGFKSIVPNENTDSLFLYYLLKSNVEAIASNASGTTFLEISGKAMEEIEVSIPEDKNEQIQIAKILDAFDRKIENNLKLNDYLAEIRQLIVKMKISDIFNRDGDSCSLVPLKKVANIQSGYSYKSKELTDNSQIGMLTIKNFQRNGLFKLDGFKPINPEKAKESHYVTAGEIVVAHTDLTQNADIIGRAIQVIDNGGFDKILASCDLVKVSSANESISNELLAALLATSDFYNHCLGYVNGTTVLHLGKKALHEYNLKIPNNTKLLQTLDCCFQSIAFYQSYLIQETRILKRSRDLLLTKLLSGDIDVLKSINE